MPGILFWSRDIVVGSYLGSDNLVQLADSIGVGLSYGRGSYLTGSADARHGERRHFDQPHVHPSHAGSDDQGRDEHAFQKTCLFPIKKIASRTFSTRSCLCQ